MSANDSERRSMDDVLASIRRIIRAEKEQPTGSAMPGAQSAMTAEPVPEPAQATSEPEPMPLTFDMVVEEETDNSPAPAENAEPTPVPEEPAADLPEAAEEPALEEPLALDEATIIATSEEPQPAPALDEAAIEEIVKRVLHEALMGEIGQNISANVKQLVETEVAKQLRDRG